MAVGVAEEGPHLVAPIDATAEDASDLEATWQEWHQGLQETRQKMVALGMHLIDVTVDLNELDAYCQQRGLANTGSTRAEYAAHVLSEQHQRQAQLLPRLSMKRRAKKRKHRL